MSGATNIHEDSYIADEAMATRFVFVAIGASAGSCKLVSSTGEQSQILGIIQDTAVAGQPVRVRKLGNSMLKAGGTFARGDRLTGKTSATKGSGVKVTEPTVPANATTPTAAEVNAARDYATALRTLEEQTAAVAEEAAVSGDLVLVTLGKGGVQ